MLNVKNVCHYLCGYQDHFTLVLVELMFSAEVTMVGTICRWLKQSLRLVAPSNFKYMLS